MGNKKREYIKDKAGTMEPGSKYKNITFVYIHEFNKGYRSKYTQQRTGMVIYLYSPILLET
jgi:hypothetical protein